MSTKFAYEFPRPALTADIVVTRGREILLIERGGEPFKGCWALPGGFVNPGEDAAEAACRELYEEVGITTLPYSLTEVASFTRPERDPRGWVVSIAFSLRVPLGTEAEAADDAAGLAWVPLDMLPPLAFDHAEIIARTLAHGEVAV